MTQCVYGNSNNPLVCFIGLNVKMNSALFPFTCQLNPISHAAQKAPSDVNSALSLFCKHIGCLREWSVHCSSVYLQRELF